MIHQNDAHGEWLPVARDHPSALALVNSSLTSHKRRAAPKS